MRIGFTVIEVLIVAAATAIVLLFATRFFLQQQKHGQTEGLRTLAKNEMEALSNEITRSFKERLTPRFPTEPNPAYQSPVSSGFPAASQCDDLKIARRNTSVTPETIEWIGVFTECGGDCVRVRRYQQDEVTIIPPVLAFPSSNALKSVSVCFRDQGTQITVEMRGSIQVGEEATPLNLKSVLPVKETSSGVEYLPR